MHVKLPHMTVTVTSLPCLPNLEVVVCVDKSTSCCMQTFVDFLRCESLEGPVRIDQTLAES